MADDIQAQFKADILVQLSKINSLATGGKIGTVPSAGKNKNASDLTCYGVILRTDLKDRTALVKWIQVNTPKGPKGEVGFLSATELKF